jgi:hypothetical protein
MTERLSAVALTLALAAGQATVCAGWAPTPEARMACCSDDGACPMHKAGSTDHGATHGVTQPEADRCCAASDRNGLAPPAPSVAVTITLAVVPSPVPTLLTRSESHAAIWRLLAPIPTVGIPKHFLLSVLLV